MTLSLLGCGSSESPFEQATGSALGKSHCAGTPVASTKHKFESTGRTVVIDACPPGSTGKVELAARDAATGKAVDFEDLRRDDAAVFHDVRGTIGGKMEAHMDQRPGAVFDAHVWFRIDLGDAPEKEAELADPVQSAQFAAKREARTRLAAHALAESVKWVPGLEVVTKVAAPVEYGAPVLRVRGSAAALHQVGKLSTVWRVMLESDASQTHSADFYCTTETDDIDPLGLDGTGQTVAVLERTSPDSVHNLPNAIGDANGCLPDPPFGPRKKCHCPAGSRSAHPRLMAGMVANSSTSFGGLADQASLIFANWGGCTTNGPDQFSSGLNWAVSNGARIISRSEGWPPPWESLDDGMQTSRDFLVDYTISRSPYPFIAESTGNDAGYPSANVLRNGMVVGGGNETNGCSRSGVVFADTSWANPNPGASFKGFEVPHIVGIAANADSAGYDPGAVEATGGSSAAAAQVAATVASLHEANSALRSWPEVVVPGLMVSANEDVDGVSLNLHDDWDDRDGAGLLNASWAYLTLGTARKMNGGNSPEPRGHDYGGIAPSQTPPGTSYGEVWSARIDSGRTLRVAALLQSRPNCPSNPGCSEQFEGGVVGGCSATNICSANPYVIFSLEIWEGSTLHTLSFNAFTSYQFASWQNTSGSTKTYQIKITPWSYGGLSYTTWGMAWFEE
ncbi:MAG: hypothetical protein HYZ29_06250 [Myxococcales bacterium]|nr:hypothetical protein [Myxococcales bacterium]